MAGKIQSAIIAALVLITILDPVHAGDSDTELSSINGETMGTTYQVKFRLGDVEARPAARVSNIRQKIEKRLDEINRSMSTYLSHSEIRRFNETPTTEEFPVSSDFRRVVERALEIHRLTEGKFDVTVGPLVRFWGFGGGKIPRQIPRPQEIDQVLRRIGSGHLSVTEKGIRKSIPGLEVDLSAIAKGFAVDEICRLLAEDSNDFMVEIGGEVRTAGSNPITKQPWMIGIELPSNNPLVVDRPIASKVQLSNQSLATSGDYRNYVVIQDKKYQHTMDPVSGYPVDRGIFSVSVVADDCLTADGLATGMMAMTLEDTQRLCDDRGIAAFVIYRNDEGEIDWWRSKSFPGEVLLGRETGKKSPSGEQDEKAEEGENPVYVILGTMIVFGLALSGMAIGVITSNRELKGSCGGLSAMSENGQGDASPCSLCTKPASECSKRSEMEDSEAQKT